MTMPNFEPVNLDAQIKEARKQMAILEHVMDRKIERRQIHPIVGAAEKQCMQSVVRTLETLRDALGGDAIPVKSPEILALVEKRRSA